MKTTKACAQCGLTFLARSDSYRFCSKSCAISARYKHLSLTCEQCGEQFQVVGKLRAQRFCSQACAGRSRVGQFRTPRVPQVCSECSTAFISPRPDRPYKYCSRACARRAQMRQRAEVRTAERLALISKQCAACGKTKPLTEFHARTEPGRVAQHASYCTPCDNERGKKNYASRPPVRKERYRQSQLKRRYGLTLAQYDALLASQGGSCPICGAIIDRPELRSVDHCHDSGRVRAILCRLCNVGLGSFRDDPVRLRRAAEYLAQHA